LWTEAEVLETEVGGLEIEVEDSDGEILVQGDGEEVILGKFYVILKLDLVGEVGGLFGEELDISLEQVKVLCMVGR
jgi:hypothetical protein